MKISLIQPPYFLFLVVFINFYIRRYHFFFNFQNFIQHYLEKKIFVTNFLFITDSLNLPSYPPPEHPQLAKHENFFCRCSLTFLLLFVGKHQKPVTRQYIRKAHLLSRKVNYWSYFPCVKNALHSGLSVYPGFKAFWS